MRKMKARMQRPKSDREQLLAKYERQGKFEICQKIMNHGEVVDNLLSLLKQLDKLI